MEETQGRGLGGGTQELLSNAVRAQDLAGAWICSPTRKLFKLHCSGFFYRGFITWAHWLNHCSLVNELNLWRLCPAEDWGMGLRVPILWSHARPSGVARPSLETTQEPTMSHLVGTNSDVVWSERGLSEWQKTPLSLRKSQGFLNLCAGTRDKDQIYVCLHL